MELKDCIMEMLPEEEQSAVRELTEDYEEGEPEDFFDKYPELLSGYEDEDEFLEEVSDGTVTLGTVLIWYLAERGFLFPMDWDGEEEEGLLAAYINYRLECMDCDFTVDTEPFYRRVSAFGWKPEPENLTWALIQEADRQLRQKGYCLLGADPFCEPDTVYLGVYSFRRAGLLMKKAPDDVDLSWAADL